MLTCLSQLDGARKVTGVASGAGQVGDYRSPTLEHRTLLIRRSKKVPERKYGKAQSLSFPSTRLSR